MTTNIFLNAYKQAENKLTYNFLAIIELLNNQEFCEFLSGMTLSEKPVQNVRTVYGGNQSNPDGSFMLKKSNGDLATIFFENKTKRRGLSIPQLVSHLKLCKAEDILLVITPRKSDIDHIRALNSPQIKFYTWAEVATFLKKLNDTIANQFIDYGQLSGEFEELGEIDKSEIEVYCNYLKSNFDTKMTTILEHFHHEIDLTKYGFKTGKRQDVRWGRKGTEFNVNGDYFKFDSSKYSYGQFWTIAYYDDTKDHQIPFKKEVPEIAIFFDIYSEQRTLIQDDKELKAIFEDLKVLGFESNLDMELTKNPWRLLCYRKPILEFNELSVAALLKFSDEVFEKLLSTDAISHPYFHQLM